MTDREKVIKGLECHADRTNLSCNIAKCPYYELDFCGVILSQDALALLKEQEDLGTELTNAVELIHKKNERIEKLMKEQEAQKFFVDESGKITPLPVVVRCKDCKHRPELKLYSDRHGNYTAVEFPDGSKCPCQCEDFFYSWYPKDDWFCANGERR